MLARVREKAEALALANVVTLQHDLTVRPIEGREFDVIITGMTLHHVRYVAAKSQLPGLFHGRACSS